MFCGIIGFDPVKEDLLVPLWTPRRKYEPPGDPHRSLLVRFRLCKSSTAQHNDGEHGGECSRSDFHATLIIAPTTATGGSEFLLDPGVLYG
jgi:hypothetical protein